MNRFSRSAVTGVRVLVGGGEGFATACGAGLEDVSRLTHDAAAFAAISPKDPHRALPAPVDGSLGAPQDDPEILRWSSADILADLADVEEGLLKQDPRVRKVIRLERHEALHRTDSAATTGARLTGTRSETGFFVEVLVEADGETEVGWDGGRARFSDDVDAAGIANGAVADALRLLGARPLASGAYDALFPPHVFSQVLRLLAQGLSAEAVERGRSFLQGRINKRVGSAHVSVVDDPGRPRGLGSVSCDDEGVVPGRLEVIAGGMLRDTFFDQRTAGRAGKRSNGRGFRSGAGAPPHPRHTNLCVMPGDVTKESLHDGKRVFVLHNLLGLHTADPVTGEFSLGAAGFLYEGGAFRHAVRGVTISGTLLGLLNSVEALGSDLTWFGSIGAPSARVSGLSVAGA